MEGLIHDQVLAIENSLAYGGDPGCAHDRSQFRGSLGQRLDSVGRPYLAVEDAFQPERRLGGFTPNTFLAVSAMSMQAIVNRDSHVHERS